MTTSNSQGRLISAADELGQYERQLELLLAQLSAWSKLPDERTDWELETLLDDVRTAAMALRHLRGEADLPF